MRRPLVLLLPLLVFGAPCASAAELRFVAGFDAFLANVPGQRNLANAEFGLSLRGEVRGLAGRVDLKLDLVDREAAVGNFARRELHELSLTVRSLGGRVDLTAGRFLGPGGFWLFVDGAALRVRLTSALSAQVYGGLRAFTNARVEANLRADPLLLPLVGAAMAVDHRLIQGALSYVYAQDRVELHRGLAPDGADFALDGATVGREINQAYDRLPEHLVDGHVVVFPHPSLSLRAGLSLGTRNEVLYSSVAERLALAPVFGVRPFEAFMGYGALEWRPHKRLRLSASFLYNRIKLPTVQDPRDHRRPLPEGSFHDSTVKGAVRIWRSLRAELRYRLRVRDNDDLMHRLEAGATWDHLGRGFGLFLSGAADLYALQRTPTEQTLVPQPTLLVRGGASFVHHRVDLRAGVLYTDGIGALAAQAEKLRGEHDPRTISPIVLEVQRIAFVRAFLLVHQLFAGVDAELGLDGRQFRILLQTGYAL